MKDLKVNVGNYITADMVNSIKTLRLQLIDQINRLETKHRLPSRGESDWYDRLVELGGAEAEEIETAYWVLDEVRNIKSSLEEIDRALAEPALDTGVQYSR
jgi:hypothetical protein